MQSDRVDKSAVGFDYQGKTEKHESQRGGWAGRVYPTDCRGAQGPSSRVRLLKPSELSLPLRIGLCFIYTNLLI